MSKQLILILVIIPVLLSGQSIRVSEEMSTRNDDAYYLAGQLEDNFLLFRDRTESFEVQAFDSNMHMAWKKKLEFEKKNVKVIDVIPGKTSFAVIYRHHEKGKTILKVNTFDKSAGILDTATIINYGKRFFPPFPKIITSDDKSKFIAYHYEKQNELEAISFDLVEMKQSWHSKIKPEGLSNMKDISDVVIDNKGNLHLLINRDNRKSKLAEHRYEIYQTGPSFIGIEKFSINMEGRMTYDDHFSYDNKNKMLYAAGLFSDKNRGKANGYFFLKIPPNDKENYALNFSPFGDKFISNFTGKPIKKNKGLPYLDIREIIHRTDGGILLVVENIKTHEHSHVSRGSFPGSPSRNIIDYYYDDIFVISIHPSGEIHWHTFLRKKQYSQDDNAIYSSYFLAKTPRSLRMLFNDDIRTENTVSEYVITGNGESDRNSLLNTADQDLQLRFKEAMQISSSEIIIPSQLKYKLKLVKLTLNKQ